MKDRYAEAQRGIEEFARKLDAAYSLYGRDGLRGHNSTEVCVLYLCVQNDLEKVSHKIDKGNGQESDLVAKEQLQAKLNDLFAIISEKTDVERGRQSRPQEYQKILDETPRNGAHGANREPEREPER